MSVDLRLIFVSAASYLAAGTFYVLRGLARTSTARNFNYWDGLSVVALLWLPIVVENLLLSYRQHATESVLRGFLLEAAPPLALFLLGVICGMKRIFV